MLKNKIINDSNSEGIIKNRIITLIKEIKDLILQKIADLGLSKDILSKAQEAAHEAKELNDADTLHIVLRHIDLIPELLSDKTGAINKRIQQLIKLCESYNKPWFQDFMTKTIYDNGLMEIFKEVTKNNINPDILTLQAKLDVYDTGVKNKQAEEELKQIPALTNKQVCLKLQEICVKAKFGKIITKDPNWPLINALTKEVINRSIPYSQIFVDSDVTGYPENRIKVMSSLDAKSYELLVENSLNALFKENNAITSGTDLLYTKPLNGKSSKELCTSINMKSLIELMEANPVSFLNALTRFPKSNITASNLNNQVDFVFLIIKALPKINDMRIYNDQKSDFIVSSKKFLERIQIYINYDKVGNLKNIFVDKKGVFYFVKPEGKIPEGNIPLSQYINDTTGKIDEGITMLSPKQIR